MGEATQDLN